MKKKIPVVLLSMTMILLLVGCVDPEKKSMYENDTVSILGFTSDVDQLSSDDLVVYGQGIIDFANEMDVASEEAVQVREDFIELGNLMVELGNAYLDLDQEKMDSVMAEIEEINITIEQDGDLFGQAAEDAGVTDKLLQDLE